MVSFCACIKQQENLSYKLSQQNVLLCCAGKLMAAFVQGLNDRNSSVRKNYASALAHLVKVSCYAHFQERERYATCRKEPIQYILFLEMAHIFLLTCCFVSFTYWFAARIFCLACCVFWQYVLACIVCLYVQKWTFLIRHVFFVCVQVGKDSSTEKLILKLKSWYLDSDSKCWPSFCSMTNSTRKQFP